MTPCLFSPRRLPSTPLSTPRRLLLLPGAFFFLALASCEKKESSSWQQAQSSPGTPTASTTPSSPEASTPPDNHPKNNPAPSPIPGEVRFLFYNVENYLEMERRTPQGRTLAPKPEAEIQALIEIIAEARPDILGLCEIGTPQDLADLQRRLKEAGVDLPHTEHTGGWDRTRHLALLSRFPILERNSQRKLYYEQENASLQHSRGILDVTIDPGFGPVHFVGIHLKSKREIPDHSQELMRQNEALLTRRHVTTLLEQDPQTKVLVYGDFNDTRRSPAVTSLQGQSNSSKHLADLFLKDQDGLCWTHFWSHQQVYSRIDYILYSKGLAPHIDQEKSRLLDSPRWHEASDHRGLLTILHPDSPNSP